MRYILHIASIRKTNNDGIFAYQVVVQYDSDTPLPTSFKLKLSKFLRENKPADFNFHLHMEQVQPRTKRRRVTARDTAASRTPRGYDDGSDFPVLVVDEDDERCPHCLCNPCVIACPPTFLRGSAAPLIGNRTKRFKLYQKFWQLLADVGLWYHPEYLPRKISRTERDDPREIIPDCVIEAVRKQSRLVTGIRS